MPNRKSRPEFICLDVVILNHWVNEGGPIIYIDPPEYRPRFNCMF